jgi:hypothetical protein
MLTVEPATPELGDKPVIFGVGIRVKLTPPLHARSTCTVRFPELAVAGTTTEIELSVQLVGVTSKEFGEVNFTRVVS